MKIAKKISLCTLLLGMLLLSACGTQDADIEAAMLEHSPEGFTRVSLEVGSAQAGLSGKLDGKMRYGEMVPLRAAPFLEDGVIYFPLEDVVPLMGGTCQVEGDTAHVCLNEQNIIYRAGSAQMSVNGTIYQSQDGRMPQIVDGVYFLPHGMQPTEGYTGLDGPLNWVYPETGRMVLSESNYPNCELCAAGAWLEEPFNDIPASVRRTLNSMGTEHPEDAQSNAERYDGDGISIWVDRPMEGEDRDDTYTGFVVCIQLTGNKYQTWRGLRVGDSRARAELLYGDLSPDSGLFPAYPLQVEFDEMDRVSKITFNSYLFYTE